MKAITRITRHYNRTLFFASGMIFLSSVNYGFDNTGFSSTQAMDGFIQQFGEINPATNKHWIPPYFLSLMNSLVFIGFACGLYFGSVVSARYGRRMIMFTMSIWALCCAAVIVSAKSREQMLIGRILNYSYVGMEMSVVGNFQAELVPREVRGFAVGSYQMAIGMGGIIIGVVCNFTRNIGVNDDRSINLQWQIPMALYFVIPTIVACGTWFMPESPRWLASKGRMEEARASLQRVRVDKSVAAIDAELGNIQNVLHSLQSQGSYRDLFRGTNTRRTLIVYIASIFVQFTGQAFVSTYGAVFYRSIGVANPFSLTASTSALMTTAVLINMYLLDLIGRRNILILGSLLQATCVFVIGSMGMKANTLDNRMVIVGFNMLFGFSYGLGWGPAHWTITAEIPEQRLRDKVARTAGIIVIIGNFLVAFSIPYLLYEPYAALSSKVGFIFAPICVLAGLWVFFFLPETKGLSLENIDRLFHERVGTLQSLKWKPTPVAEEAPVEDEEEKKVEISMHEVVNKT